MEIKGLLLWVFMVHRKLFLLPNLGMKFIIVSIVNAIFMVIIVLYVVVRYLKYQDAGIGVFISHTDGSKPTKEEIETAQRETNKKLHLAWDSAVPMGGNPVDIYEFNLMLSVGDISENRDPVSSENKHWNTYTVFTRTMKGIRRLRKYFKRLLRA